LIYANFNKYTNLNVRQNVENICKNEKHITWDNPNKSYNTFITECLDHEMIVCPEGNGPDTHRFWETLYIGRVPIAKKNIATEDFIDLPVVWLDSWEELTDENFIIHKFRQTKSKNLNLCLMNYWENLIKSLL
jgi:hypothetical protein